MTDQISTFSYDEIPYPGYSFAETHPDRLATIATLLGMAPAAVESCRVLELGCANGGNLIPMAYSLPRAAFVGVDLAAAQIAQGQAMIEALGLANVSLAHRDIMAVGPELGQFDYIIAHGIYSWVPPEVQAKILAICKENLAPHGVAYVSYNAYPGWRLHGAIREMMLYHTREIADPRQKIAAARELLDFLADSPIGESSAHASFLHSYANYVRERYLPLDEDAYLYHNELSLFNEPVYFYQFAERAAEQGLQYLGDVQFQSMLTGNLPPELDSKLRRMAQSTVAVEQYMDFLRNRPFRRSLLCHDHLQLKAKLSMAQVVNFYLASAVAPAEEAIDLHAEAALEFKGPQGQTFTTNHPVTKAAMGHLADIWPQALGFKALLAAAYTRLGDLSPPEIPPAQLEADGQLLALNLIKAFSASESLLELHVQPFPFVRTVSDRPRASDVARYQAGRGPVVTNLRHELLRLEGNLLRLLPHLDGRRDRAALLEALDESTPGSSEPTKQVEQAPEEILEASLQSLANAALLVG